MTGRIVDRATGAIVGIVAIFVIAILAGVVDAGPLDPGGPPGSTPGVRLPGTPISSVPFTISATGQYYLTNNVTGIAGNRGITIDASNVTIDLNGFTLTGPAGSLDGIFVNTPSRNVTIRNGSVVDWDGIGIEVSNAREAVVEDVQVSGVGGSGIVTANGARISRCTVAQSGAYGIDAGEANIIADCTVTDNVAAPGVDAAARSVISRVTSTNNGAGFFVGAYSLVNNCTAGDNNGIGIQVAGNSIVDGCTASNNGSVGINGLGLSVVIRNSTATSNFGNGIVIDDGGLVEGCTADDNGVNGIRALDGGVIRGNTARNNDLHGIIVDQHSLVEGNLAVSNGVVQVGAGIHVATNNNHIERNIVSGNDKGIEVIGGFNTVVGNTARSNGAAGLADELVFPVSTIAGPTLDGTSVDTATNPYANFSP